MEDLGKKLFYLRTAARYSQEYVAKQIGVSTTVYGAIEKNTAPITIERLSQILALYNLTLASFFAVRECDLVNFMKGETPAFTKWEFLPELFKRLDAIITLLQMLLKNSLITLQNQNNQRRA